MNPVTDYLFGEVKKMVITAYSEPERTSTSKVIQGEYTDGFKIKYNPNSYSQKFEVDYQERVGQGNEGGEQTPTQTQPKSFEFEFLFDGTGAAPEPGFGVGIALPFIGDKLPRLEVSKMIDDFLTYCIKRNRDIHRPNYLKINWGKLESDCVMKSADVTYTLFKPDGQPLRARVKCVFLEDKEGTLRVREQNDRSPDLTHIREVNEGDNLSFVSDSQYQDPKYYFDLAKVNKLKNFRRLKVGNELKIPPLKNEANT